jgi:dTDP-4-dehydrorhamnose reductase
MKILLFGKHGQLGWELHRSLQGLGQVIAYDYPEVDFQVPSSLRRLVEEIAPQLVINAAAYTDVDKAESEPEQAKLVNTEAPGILAETCRNLGAAFIHYSTDYVFDGQKGAPYTEDDLPHPLNVYGHTKLEGERAVLAAGGCNLIFRTAWVYSLRRDSFVTKVLRWAHTQTELRIVDDQISNPTWARALAEVTAQVVARANVDPLSGLDDRQGLYHLAAQGYTSRFSWAKEITRRDRNISQQVARNIVPVQGTEFCSSAIRPGFSALDCRRFEQTFNLQMSDWVPALSLAMED